MNIETFIERRPFLYHLTDTRNFPNIIEGGTILSTKAIVELSDLANPEVYLSSKRPEHTQIDINGVLYHIRDQQPISEVVLARSLTDNWTNGDFINHLNSRVFFWPTIQRLVRHFNRYQTEDPIILRFRTSDILALNEAEFCRLNSGATRCSSHWGGNAPERGPNTFLSADMYEGKPASVAEVTIPGSCDLPDIFWTSTNPNGPWTSNN